MTDADIGDASHAPLEPGDRAARQRRRDPATALELVRDWGLVLLLAWVPLPFGSARPWAWSLVGLLTVVLLVISAAAAATTERPMQPVRRLAVPLLLGVLLVAWALLQSMPGGLAGLHHPLWDVAAAYLDPRPTVSISVDREASRVHLFRLMSYCGIAWIAWQAGQRRDGALLIVRAIALIATIYAAYGVVEYASASPSILWYRKWTYPDDLTSTFVNRNSYATFAGLGVIANLMLFARAMMSRVDTSSRRTVTLSMIENFVARGKWAVVGLVLVGSALLLSHSRGGSSSTLCGVIAFAAAVAVAPSLRSRQQLVFGALLALGCIVVFTTSGAGLMARFADTSIEADGRNDLYRAMLHAIGDNFLLGTGLGSFRSIYPMYQGVTFNGGMDFAHNDYLENVLDLGVPGAALLFAMIAILVGFCVVGIMRRRRDAVFACAAVAATVVVAVHALVDFSMQIPAVAVTYAAILGVGTAQSVSSRRGRADG